MFKIYKNKYPNVTITNSAVAGGAGSTAKAVLATRMQGGRPPDSFQVHAGQELIASWVKANKMEAITSIWNSEGWDSKIPKDLKDIVSSNGDVWSVPVNVHRGNALWYNKKVLDSKGVSPPDTPEQLTSALSSLKAKGIANPLALASKGGNWQVQMLLKTTNWSLVADDFNNRMIRDRASFTKARVVQARTWWKQRLPYATTTNPT